MRSEEKRTVHAMRSIVENIDAAKEFTAGFTFEQFLSRREKVYAVIRALEIVSEASRRLPDSPTERRPEIPWRAIKSAGNVYRHEYEEVSLEVIWDTATAGLASMRNVIVDELRLRGEAVD
jgi:uncharacterized protein with HEPN domain